MRLRDETRRRARTAQLLYAWELQERPDLRQTASALLAGYPRCRGAIEEAEAVASELVGEVAALDDEITSAVEHWRMERIGTMERVILRLGLFELSKGDPPPKVVISEAVRLAHWFGGGSAPGFVNGVLDAVARKSGRL